MRCRPASRLAAGWFNDSTLASYARYHAHNYTLLQAALLSQPHTPTASNATIMRIQAPDQLEQGSADSFAFTESLEEQIATLVDAAGGRGALTVHLAGMPAFIRAAQAGVTADMAKMDTISFPLALLVFVCMLRSLRLLLLPVRSASRGSSAPLTTPPRLTPYSRPFALALTRLLAPTPCSSPTRCVSPSAGRCSTSPWSSRRPSRSCTPSRYR